MYDRYAKHKLLICKECNCIIYHDRALSIRHLAVAYDVYSSVAVMGAAPANTCAATHLSAVHQMYVKNLKKV